mmetsp:Transcript_20559/g.71143  ORF Transcript_20559/g.71143 Transcript_20559/m.71143 type:complete len:224 (-) Transcript_20559:7-678(-)
MGDPLVSVPCQLGVRCDGREKCPLQSANIVTMPSRGFRPCTVRVLGCCPSHDEPTEALAKEKPGVHELICRPFAVDATVICQNILRKRLDVVEVQRLAVAAAPAAHVRGENGDSLCGEACCELGVDTRVIDCPVDDHERGPRLGLVHRLPGPREKPEPVVVGAVEAAAVSLVDERHHRPRCTVVDRLMLRHRRHPTPILTHGESCVDARASNCQSTTVRFFEL